MLVLCSNGLSSKEILSNIKCCIYEKEHNVTVIRLNDGEGVFIDEEIYVCKL